MVAVRNYHGTPSPPGKPPLSFQTGDVIELLKGDPDTSWFAGNMEQQQADNRLKSHSSGTYLTRERICHQHQFSDDAEHPVYQQEPGEISPGGVGRGEGQG
ncbi:hypothetical protein SKAU_G00284090 [Synaphobranchus kaupii]|uniref:SH3 domain-containing protein n=1 Tax=Synaphobranchus kaupii TaxID=118154 RepID=A0A9Q1EXV5_SYNKA|nr:hypothetical protein SKAU_G00284090 [Synaphobranchus kaupii]